MHSPLASNDGYQIGLHKVWVTLTHIVGEKDGGVQRRLVCLSCLQPSASSDCKDKSESHHRHLPKRNSGQSLDECRAGRLGAVTYGNHKCMLLFKPVGPADSVQETEEHIQLYSALSDKTAGKPFYGTMTPLSHMPRHSQQRKKGCISGPALSKFYLKQTDNIHIKAPLAGSRLKNLVSGEDVVIQR